MEDGSGGREDAVAMVMEHLGVLGGRRGVLQPVVVALGLGWATLALLQFPHL